MWINNNVHDLSGVFVSFGEKSEKPPSFLEIGV